MKKMILATLALTLATPAFAGELLDSHGHPVGTKDSAVVATMGETVQAATPEAAPAAATTKATTEKSCHHNVGKKGAKHKKRAHKGKKARAAAAPAAAVETPVESLVRTKSVEKR